MATDDLAYAMTVTAGTRVDVEATFYELLGVDDVAVTPDDPTIVSCRVKQGSLPAEEFVNGTDNEMSNPSTGVYRCTVVLTQPGISWFEFVAASTSGISAVKDIAVMVNRAAIGALT